VVIEEAYDRVEDFVCLGRAQHHRICSFFLVHAALTSAADRDFDLACTGAHKQFNLARGNKCPPSGNARQVAGLLRFIYEPFEIFMGHDIAAVSTANFIYTKADE
jgi:hypothetical protein